MNYKNIILLILGNNISLNFTIHIDKHNNTVYYKKLDKSL